MAYNEKLTNRVREALVDVKNIEEKKMFRGVTFMVNGKMCLSVGDDEIMCRIDPAQHESALEKRGTRTLLMKGREYKGYLMVHEDVLKQKKTWAIGCNFPWILINKLSPLKKLKVEQEKPLVNKTYLLEKYPGKGGWTYVTIPGIRRDKKKAFGWVKVKGSIDGFALRNYTLMPMKNGDMFLPVKVEIRKKIKKKDGDWVKIILFADNDTLEIPPELLLCLEDEPGAHKTFLSFTVAEQKAYITWIFSAKKEETKVAHIAKTMDRLGKKPKLTDK